MFSESVLYYIYLAALMNAVEMRALFIAMMTSRQDKIYFESARHRININSKELLNITTNLL